jgi:hypothetical protein
VNRWQKRQRQKLLKRLQLQAALAEKPKGTKLATEKPKGKK